MKSFTDFPEERFKKGAILALFEKVSDKFMQDLKISSARLSKSLWIVKFDGLDSINQVEKFRDFTLKVAEENLSNLADGEFYYHEIIGLDVYDVAGEKIGKISEILQPGANDVWVIKRQGKSDLLLPYILSVVLAVDLAEKRVTVEVPEGLD